MAEVGFIVDKSDTALFIDTGQKTYNQTQAEKVTQRDLVINFRKPYPGEITGQLSLFDASDFATFLEAARAVLVEVLTNHPGSTTDRLYDELVSRLVRKGQFERHDFDELLRSVAEVKYKGFLCLELNPERVSPEGMRRSRDLLRRKMMELGLP
jgi:hypothetical protein